MFFFRATKPLQSINGVVARGHISQPCRRPRIRHRTAATPRFPSVLLVVTTVPTVWPFSSHSASYGCNPFSLLLLRQCICDSFIHSLFWKTVRKHQLTLPFRQREDPGFAKFALPWVPIKKYRESHRRR